MLALFSTSGDRSREERQPMKTMPLFLGLQLYAQLSISPSGIHLKAAGIQQFTATPPPCYAWTASIGSINLSGVYQAPFNIPIPQTVTIGCSISSGGSNPANFTTASGLTTITLDASSTPTAGFSWNRGGIYGGTVLIETPQNPLYASSGKVLLDFDPNLLTFVPSSTRPGQQALSVNVANLPPGPQGPPGTPGMSCPQPASCTGIILVTNPDGTVSPSINSAYANTRGLDVANVDHWCQDTSGTTGQYSCGTPNPAAWSNNGGVGYATGSWVFLVPQSTSAGSASLNVNNQGIVNIKLADGTTDPGPRLQGGRWYLLVFNGTVWTMSQGDSI